VASSISCPNVQTSSISCDCIQMCRRENCKGRTLMGAAVRTELCTSPASGKLILVDGFPIRGLSARGVLWMVLRNLRARSLLPAVRDVLNLGVTRCCHRSLGSSYLIRYSPMTERTSNLRAPFDTPLPMPHLGCGSQSAVVAIRTVLCANAVNLISLHPSVALCSCRLQ
jgi:hypothetical protein